MTTTDIVPAIPTCRRCGEVPSFVTGVSVHVAFDQPTGTATIRVDLSDIADGPEPLCACTARDIDPKPCDLSDEDAATLNRHMIEVGAMVAPEVDYSLGQTR